MGVGAPGGPGRRAEREVRGSLCGDPLDLSGVLFIATANTTQTIPGPLLDRMEVIEVSSYTENEKFHIARNYLVTKQLERNGLDKGKLTISDKALEKDHPQLYQRGRRPESGAADRGRSAGRRPGNSWREIRPLYG